MQSYIATHLIIEGRVQGVFFRASLVKEATRHQITGWVRNRRDGTVEAWLQGPPQEVETVLQWGRRGPQNADVTGLTITDVSPDPQLHAFEQRPDA